MLQSCDNAAMNHFTAPVLTVIPDDDLPRFPDPADDALASPQARRYSRSITDGQRAYTEARKPLPVSIHG
jgi:hypothetical protein